MTATTTRPRARQTAGPLKSPLAAAAAPARPGPPGPGRPAAARQEALAGRAAVLAEFADYLETRTSPRTKRPYEHSTINAYVLPARNLDDWMTARGIGGDFTDADTALLNRYFREYYDEHGQGGTHTLQRNLIQLFNFLRDEHGHPTPYTDKLNRYSQERGRPRTLSAEFIGDLLEVTGGGRSRDFEDARDHAIIRILRNEGIRRSELLCMVMHTLPANVVQNPVFRVVPLKGARVIGSGRLVGLSPSSARALATYLRARRHHKLADSDWVWLGTRNRGRLGNTGLRKMIDRRVAQAGYEHVMPKQFRDTFCNGWLASGGQEGDLMRLNGWKSRAMVDWYADDVAEQRALEAKRAMGDPQ